MDGVPGRKSPKNPFSEGFLTHAAVGQPLMGILGLHAV